MERIAPEVGETQGFVQFLMDGAELIEQQFYLHQTVVEVADGDRGEAFVIGGQRCPGGGPGGNTELGE